ncbi:NDP-hexose 2,3-dehydratase family protein [Nocardiopsis ansamitocini]|uniref:NDP-hexose 2,3-dehydratase n=1 Tax=Nocardiopsis ansamitocini TaxID=1670832 RepID=A0A9W6P752_9ACTN|nr:NDP-hexose 2,3-dehydratase family protein [Nocardiopsis ansamitocini]GLU48715.1 NDP-hexose 2,3-dehydratase [Nocardiopsis ansamitocini]
MGASPRPPAPSLRQRDEPATARRFARSAATLSGTRVETADCLAWLEQRRRAHPFLIRQIPFSELDGWSFAPDTGNLVHRSGGFFSVEGLSVSIDGETPRAWQQPVIVQPEIGVLGFLAKEFDGVLHLLVQAKMEPGNPGTVQLSPTVQATRSNYSGAHSGKGVRYIDYFLSPDRGRVLADVLQSEHGSWFFRKMNRNMVVEVHDDVPPHEDFRWLTLGQLGELLRMDNVVNMDARTVLACVPTASTDTRALLSDTALRSWFVAERSRYTMRAALVPLARTAGWSRDGLAISRPDGRYFTVTAVAVEAPNREVTGWSQPLLAPTGTGVTAFVVRRFGGVPHLLAHARAEGGLHDVIELGPTVQRTPRNYPSGRGAVRPPFLDLVLGAGPDSIRYDAVHSEEGGRFRDARSRCLFVEATEGEAPTAAPPGYVWVTPDQMNSLVRHSRYVNVQARTLLAAVTTGAVVL